MLISPLKISPLSLRRGTSFNKTYCSYYYDGTNNYINLTNAFSPNIEGTNKVFSMRFVIRRLSAGNNDWFFSNWQGTTNDRSMIVRFNSSDNKMDILLSSNGTGTSGNWKSDTAITDDNWHDIIFVYNQGVITVYKDGVEFTGTSTTIPTTIHAAVNTEAQLGAGAYASVYANVYINQFALTTDVITSQEVIDLYNDGSPRITSKVVNCENEYIFDNDTWDGSDWAVIDSQGNINGVSSGMIAADRDCNENPY